MKRLPFAQRDLKKLPDVAKRLLEDLDDFPLSNRHKLSEWMARISLYDTFVDLQSEVGKTPFPRPGTISRQEIRLLISIGLRKLTSMPLLAAYSRAARARLNMLTVDQSTTEYGQEQLMAQLQRETLNSGLLIDEFPHYLQEDRNWHEHAGRLMKAGAPGFELVIRKDGMAFQWERFIGLYDAVRDASKFPTHADPELLKYANDEKAMDQFLREVLVPESWVPLRELFLEGIEVPYHEVIWLFDEEGKYIARAFRHMVHGGVLGHLMLTDEDVLDGKIALMMGRTLIRGTGLSLGMSLFAPKSLPIFTLRIGGRGPHSVTDKFEVPTVPVEELQQLPALKGDYMVVHAGGKVRDDWEVGGVLVKRNNSGDYLNGYYETISWLWERDFPRLYPHFDGPQERKWDAFSDQNVFLPSQAKEFQDRATKLLSRERDTAAARLATANQAGALLGKLNSSASSETLEKVAALQFECEFTFMESGEKELALEKTLAEARRAAGELVGRYPALAAFGELSLWFALVAHHSSLEEIDLEDESLADILTQLVVLASAALRPDQEIDYFRPEYAAIAVAQWIDGRCSLDDVVLVASEYHGYALRLQDQHRRIERIKHNLDSQQDRMDHARELGYAYVAEPIPMAKPLSLAERLKGTSLRIARKTVTATQPPAAF